MLQNFAIWQPWSQDLNSSAVETALQAIPIGLVAKDLSPWSESEVFREIVKSTAAEVVGDRIDSAMSAATDGDDAWAGHLNYLGRRRSKGSS